MAEVPTREDKLEALLNIAVERRKRGEPIGPLTEILHKINVRWGTVFSEEEVEKVIREATKEFPDAELAPDLMAERIPDLEYALKPVASIGNLTLLQGEPKGGKSSIALLIALGVSLGKWPCGKWETDGKPKSVLFITYEDGRRRVQKRLRQYVAGLAEPFGPMLPVNLHIYSKDNAPRIRLETPHGVAMLRKIIKKYEAKFVVIDTLSHLSGADENSKQEMQPVMDALKDTAHELACSILVVHHTGKGGKDSGKSTIYRSRGSSVIAAAPDVILDCGARTGDVTPCFITSKDDEGGKFSIEYIRDGEEIIRWKLLDAEPEEDKYGNRKGIIEALSKLVTEHPEGVGRGEVAKEAKVSKSTVTRHLEMLREEGSIQGRKIHTANGGVTWVYAPVTHVWGNA